MYNNSSKKNQLLENRIHGEPGFPMVVYWNDFSTYIENRIPWHYHEELEFVVVTKGKVEFSVGQDIFVLEKGEGIFINSDVLHNMIPVGEEKAYMFSTVVHAGFLGAERGVLLSNKFITPFIRNKGIVYIILKPNCTWQLEILQALQRIFEEYDEKSYGYEYLLHNEICIIWMILVRESFCHAESAKQVRTIDEERIYQALQYLQEHFQENVTLNDVCAAIHVSRSECCRCFQRNLRMTPGEYLMRYRLHQAAEKLEKSEDTVTQVALEVGFHSLSYFCKMFKQYMNCTPEEYKNR